MLKTFSSLDGGLFNVIRDFFDLQPDYVFGGKRYVPSDVHPVQHMAGRRLGLDYLFGALSGIDPQLYEASKIDGAGRWRQLLHITLPGIMPTIVIMLILRMGAVMNADFQKILLMQTAPTYETSDVISTFVYRSGILEGGYTYSTAIGLFNGVINFALSLSQTRSAESLTQPVYGNRKVKR